ncbi:thiamine pyrophosphate-dependent enzyme, partial [Providencia rettgeri]|uniref:thiamine pyrophosphate-dependent enzyme n=1 Tax=Providencia rettgeri TaxID=587 RepID=UPI0032DB86F9
VIQIDVDPTSISKTVKADIPIVGDAKLTLEQMIAQLDHAAAEQDTAALQAWWKEIGIWREKQCLKYALNPNKVKPQQAIEAIYRLTNGEAYVTSDVGQHQMFAALYYPFDKPRHWINSGGLGTMGFGLPAAIGAALAHPDKTIVCFSGDGSLMMNIQELATAAEHQLNIKIVLMNNQALGMVHQQ